VVVADDGSTIEHQNAIQSVAARIGLPLTHVWHPDVGFTASKVRNLGVSAARGRYIVLLDGDCVPETDFVSRHRALAQDGFFVNGSRVLLSEGLSRDVVEGRVKAYGQDAMFWIKRRLQGDASKLGPLWRLPDFGVRKVAKFRWKGIRSCNMGVWRADYEAINGFDESFVGWGHEDADFVLRLHNSGIKRKTVSLRPRSITCGTKKRAGARVEKCGNGSTAHGKWSSSANNWLQREQAGKRCGR